MTKNKSCQDVCVISKLACCFSVQVKVQVPRKVHCIKFIVVQFSCPILLLIKLASCFHTSMNMSLCAFLCELLNCLSVKLETLTKDHPINREHRKRENLMRSTCADSKGDISLYRLVCDEGLIVCSNEEICVYHLVLKDGGFPWAWSFITGFTVSYSSSSIWSEVYVVNAWKSISTSCVGT